MTLFETETSAVESKRLANCVTPRQQKQLHFICIKQWQDDSNTKTRQCKEKQTRAYAECLGSPVSAGGHQFEKWQLREVATNLAHLHVQRHV
jgi:hypothetical protein